MKKLLITGATGFIGKHCLEQLKNLDYEVHIVTSKPQHEICIKSEYAYHTFDLLDYSHINKLFNEIKPTHLLHLAWYAVPGKYMTSMENLRWVQSSIEILRQFLFYGGQRAVFAGTCYEYNLDYGFLTEYITPIDNKTIYGASKSSLYKIIESFSELTGLSMAWGRIFYLYGPHESKERLIPYVIRSLINGETTRCSHGEQIRDFLHVSDVARAFIELLESSITGPVNIGSGIPIKLKDIISKIGSMLGKEHLIKMGEVPVPPTEPKLIIANNHRLMDEVGWKAYYNLDTGLKQTVEWWEKNIL